MSPDVQERYAHDEGGEHVMGVSRMISEGEELDSDEGIDGDGGEYNIRDEIGKDDPLGMSGLVSNNSVSRLGPHQTEIIGVG